MPKLAGVLVLNITGARRSPPATPAGRVCVDSKNSTYHQKRLKIGRSSRLEAVAKSGWCRSRRWISMSTVWNDSACHSYICRCIPRDNGLDRSTGLDWSECFKLQTILRANTGAPRYRCSSCEMQALWINTVSPSNTALTLRGE
jgi:hypothetical protein